MVFYRKAIKPERRHELIGSFRTSPLRLDRPTWGAKLPFTDLGADAALGVDGIVLPRVRHGGLL